MMLSLGVHYLNGWSMAAADGADKQRAEWPPHPDRIFMALAAAWFETGQDPAEGKALRWLESLPSPPGLHVSDAEMRQIVTSYVPVNDTTRAGERKIDALIGNPNVTIDELKKAGLGLLTEFRTRQGRSFPVAIPHEPIVYLIWNVEIPEGMRRPLDELCQKVTNVGHSASFVQMWVTLNPPQANLVPVSVMARHRLRVQTAGRLDYLERRYNRKKVLEWADLNARMEKAAGKEKSRLRDEIRTRFPTGRPLSFHPEPALWQGYDAPLPIAKAELRGTVFDPKVIVLKVAGKRLSLPATLKLTEALRGSLLKGCQVPIPEWLSGHDPGGTRSEKPHIALFPMAFVGNEHADGRVLGVALALPRGIEPVEIARVLEMWLRDEKSLPRQNHLFDGQWLECIVEVDSRDSPPVNLQIDTYLGPSQRWGSVTPVVLDRHFNGPDKWERAADSVKEACVRIGLPRPVEVQLCSVSVFEGAGNCKDYSQLKRKSDGGRMHHTHAVIVFEEEIMGPMLIGAGRYRGYGLCRPLIDARERNG
jgi:CRISPR-associated protein Csb2